MPNFTSVKAANAFVSALPSGFIMSSAYRTSWRGGNPKVRVAAPLAVVTPVDAPRAYAVAVATVEAGRGPVEVPGWFTLGTSVPVAKIEAAFQAVDAASWARFMAYVESGYSVPVFEAGTYPEFLAANGLPAFTGAAERYLESLGETFLGD